MEATMIQIEIKTNATKPEHPCLFIEGSVWELGFAG
jgi:hypothetical protein